MIRAILLCSLILSADAATVPDWVVRGIAAQESSSWYALDGHLVYVDQRIGADGERGPWQMALAAFREIEPSKSITLLDDPVAAERIARLRLLRLYSRLGDWSLVVGAWNVGVAGLHHHPQAALIYIANVEQKGRR
jgi:hypothetical protein